MSKAEIGMSFSHKTEIELKESFKADVVIPVQIPTAFNIGKTAIGLYLDLIPSIEITQSLVELPKVTFRNSYKYTMIYSNGKWGKGETFSTNNSPTFNIVELNTKNPSLGVKFDVSLRLGAGFKANKFFAKTTQFNDGKGISAYTSAISTISLGKNKNETIDNGVKKECLTLDLDLYSKVGAEINAFVNAGTSYDFPSLLSGDKSKIDNVFCYKANKLPIPIITYDNSNYKNGDTITIEEGYTTFYVSEDNSYDNDGTIDFSKTIWKFDGEVVTQAPANLKAGNYKFSLEVFDDKGDSSEIEINIVVETKPQQSSGNWMTDEDVEMDWYEATEYCEDKGGRLPTLEELVQAYNNKTAGFVNSWYWSSSSHVDNDNYAGGVSFDYGNAYYYGKHDSVYVRCVR